MSLTVIFLNSLSSAIGGVAGGFVLSRHLDQDRKHRILAISVSGFTGHYIGYLANLWAVENLGFVHAGDFIVPGAMGFLAGAIIPSVYKVFLGVLNKIQENPEKWFDYFFKKKQEQNQDQEPDI